ncbi:hypothetical protein FSARC_5757 [Fusarium sarcochroum]|uniref:Zn(2)-C6 fungal-type domain-containing protein n=1 Tax=Fusarium sarcochroum TaxID=1208366 RepID=A0A8H4TZ35_9HYPO|nr:hypothetical protein FSARC_5757 [Fusarium sarcochroum]
MDQIVINSKFPKWKRASRPKVRTGCLTWVRHLKCDEEKPTCRRCRDGRVKCDGYVLPEKKKNIVQRSSRPVSEYPLISFNSNVADSSIENCYFHHFHHWTSSQLTHSSTSSNLFLTYILPLAHTCEPIKHAIIAVGAAHRFYMAGPDTCSPLQQLKGLAMQQYNKAIAHIIPHMSLDSDFDLQCTLVCCLLFVAFESITGRYCESIRHIRAGTRLLSSPALASNTKQRDAIEKLTEMFSSLGVEASIFMEDTIIPDLRLGYYDSIYSVDTPGQPFRDLDEAAGELRKLDVASVDIMHQMPSCSDTSSDGTASYKNSPEYDKFNPLWKELDVKFQRWNSRFELTKKHIATWEYQELLSPQLNYLTLQQKFWGMCVKWEPEDESGPPIETVKAFLDAAETLAQTLTTPGHPSFSLDGDLVSGLSFVLEMCPDKTLQSRAMNLLRRLNRREGVWDSREIVELHEATRALDDPEAFYKREIPGGIPAYAAELARISPGANLIRSRFLVAD